MISRTDCSLKHTISKFRHKPHISDGGTVTPQTQFNAVTILFSCLSRTLRPGCSAPRPTPWAKIDPDRMKQQQQRLRQRHLGRIRLGLLLRARGRPASRRRYPDPRGVKQEDPLRQDRLPRGRPGGHSAERRERELN